MTTALMASYSSPNLFDLLQNLYLDVNEWMMATAYRYAWWSVLGLLSSSCCALQLILNAFSLGCAGFNSFLGPVRPVLLAMTVVLQSMSWYVAWSRPWQWIPTIAGSSLVLGLALLPEVLYCLNLSKTSKATPTMKAKTGAKEYWFKLQNVGCMACVSTVSNVLKNIPGVVDFRVSLEEGTLMLVLEASKGATQLHDVLGALDGAGFPIQQRQ